MKYVNSFLKYLVTLASVVLTAYLRYLLNPVLDESAAYIVFIPAIIISTAYGGIRQGFLSAILSFFIDNYFIISPGKFFDFGKATEISGGFSFLAVGSVISWFIDTLNKSRDEIKKYYTAFEKAGDGIFITDNNGQIQYVNEAFEKMSGFKTKEAVGKTPGIVKSGKHPPEFYEKFWKEIINGRNYRGIFINRKKNGELFYVDHTITAIKDSEGKISNYVAIWKDITKQKEIDKRKDDFMAIASHELKTPLTSIKGYATILKAKLEKSKSSPVNRYIERMEIQINNMTNLVYELLDFTRIVEGKLPLHKDKFDLNAMIAEAIADIKVASGKTAIIFANNKEKNEIPGDRERLSQVVKNLLTNALKYSDGDKKIVVRSIRRNNNALVSVKDSGIGIPKKEQNKIFERFYQVEKNIYGRKASFGIGLYICAEIVKQHKGKIWVESQEGKGSTFYFSIPIGTMQK